MVQNRTTANEPVGDIDPGCIHPSKPVRPPARPPEAQHTETGDRNAMKDKPPRTGHEQGGKDKT